MDEDYFIANFAEEPAPEALLRKYDTARERRPVEGVDVDVIEKRVNVDDVVVVAQVDITTLKVDAVVNAANEGGLGCFQVDHRCVDNVIHRASGPRLREACRTEMKKRGRPLWAGETPIVTPAFHLPAKMVIHVTGPTGNMNNRAQLLEACYTGVLESAVKHGARTIAIPCISTGLFGYPGEEAATIAMNTVTNWLKANPDQLDRVVLNTFRDSDHQIYKRSITAKWLQEAKSLLIVAGAGMSVKENDEVENVYVDELAFAKHYPYMGKFGYSTAYECIGLENDPHVPNVVKSGFRAQHMHNMGSAFKPNTGYSWLLDLVKGKNYHVLTSNVDMCFVRAGFPREKVYEPQGTWGFYQCPKPCRKDALFPSAEILQRVLPLVDPKTGVLQEEHTPACPYCNRGLIGNVRGGHYFLHNEFNGLKQAQQRFQHFVQNSQDIVVLEIGAGFNTPGVTRFPAEAVASRLIRVNPIYPQVPKNDGFPSIGFEMGWSKFISQLQKVL